MRRRSLAGAVLVPLLVLGTAVGASPAAAADPTFLPAAEQAVKDSYTVVLTTTKPEQVEPTAQRLLQAHPGKITFIYRHALLGFAVTMAEPDAMKLSQDPDVAYVSQNVVWTGATDQIDPPWGLDRVDQRTRTWDDVFGYGPTGAGVHAYVLDSAVRTTHADFEGRASVDADFIGPGPDPGSVCGHGTWVAGVVGGRVHGVAKGVRLHSVRVLRCDRTTTTDVVTAAVDWVAAHAVHPAVVNLSVGGPPERGVEAAITNLIAGGVPLVSSAGNANRDACLDSPGRLAPVINVGNVDPFDFRYGGTSGSNYGACVDLFAPGYAIPTPDITSDVATTNATGTSVSAPHVTGAVARYLQRFPVAPPDLVAATIVSEATLGVVTDPMGSPNLVLYVDRGGPGNDGFARTGADVNGDGRDDVVTFVRGAEADVYVALSDGSRFVGSGVRWHEYFATGNSVPMLGDFDGDGRDDLVMFTRGSSANVWVALSTGTSFAPPYQWHDWFAVANETPAVGDFNGDGRDDIATFTRGTGRDVYVALSDGASFVGTAVKWHDSFGADGEVPLVGDFDGDGRDDVAVATRGITADVYVARSTGSAFVATGAKWHDSFAPAHVVPAVGDVDGDGRDDIVSFNREHRGDVQVALSSGSAFGPLTLWHDSFGFGHEVPGVGDFTGDGRDDVVVFTRGQAANAYVATSSGAGFVGTGVKWHDWFAFGLEVPMPATLW